MNDVPELTLMITPAPAARMIGMTACIPTIGANTLRVKISVNAAGSISSTDAP